MTGQLFGESKLQAVLMTISQFTDDHQPGWVECRLIDAWGAEWFFVEKAPVVWSEDDDLDAQSEYPQPGAFACQIIKKWHDDEEREIVTIDLEKPWGIESKDGTTRFDVLPDQLTILK